MNVFPFFIASVFTGFAPRLSDRFEFDVGRISLLLDPVLFDCLHLGEAQVKLPMLAEVHQGVIVHRADGDDAQLEFVLAPRSDRVHVERPGDHPLDGIVRQHTLRDVIEIGGRNGGVEPVLSPGRNRLHIEAKIDESLLSAHPHIIGDAWFEEDVEESMVDG